MTYLLPLKDPVCIYIIFLIIEVHLSQLYSIVAMVSYCMLIVFAQSNFSIHSPEKTFDGNNHIWLIAAGIKKENKETFPMMANF